MKIFSSSFLFFFFFFLNADSRDNFYWNIILSSLMALVELGVFKRVILEVSLVSLLCPSKNYVALKLII
jgi:hypothetical protein